MDLVFDVLKIKYKKFNMKKLVLLIIHLLPFINYAQQNDSLKFNSFSIGGTYSADYCYRTTSTNPSNRWLKDEMDSLEISKIGYTTGLNFDFTLNNRFSISSGLLYSDKGYKLKSKVIPNIDKSIDHIYYLDIPLKFNYNIISKKTKFFISAGISSNIFLSSKILFQKENSSFTNVVKGNSDFSKINFATILNLGIQNDLSKSWYFKSEMIYRQSIMPSMKAPINQYLYSFGLNVGFYYRLK